MKRIYLLPFMALGLVACSDDLEESGSVGTAYSLNLTEEDFLRFNLEALKSTNHTISAEQAETEALDIVKNLKSGNGLKSATNRKVANVQVLGSSNSSGLKSKSNDTLAYIVNFADNMGFAYVCADDRLSNNVLAFFENGNYSSDLNENLKLMLEKTEAYIKRTVRQFEVNREELALRLEQNKEEDGKNSLKYHYSNSNFVGPLCNTHWGQDSPYNYYCPTCKTPGCTNKALTGCMNTATAQIMYYHRWPEKIVLPDGTTHYCDWDYCDKDYFSLYSYVIASNMRDIGVVYNSDYHCSNKSHGGGTSTSISASFGITNNKLSYSCYEENYSWSYVKFNLDCGFPILIAGSGHAWVVDGYFIREKRYNSGKLKWRKTFVHNNWGWAGDCDGYFEQDCFDTQDEYGYDTGKHSSNYSFNNNYLKARLLVPSRN